MVKVHITNQQAEVRVPRTGIRAVARAAGKGPWDGCSLSVAVIGEEAMAALNHRHTGREGATDVLAFALADGDPPGENLVGEVVVCASCARREAEARGVAPEEELLLYAAHGVLHLLGYDDATRDGRSRMYAREDEILRAAGVRNVRGRPRGDGAMRDRSGGTMRKGKKTKDG